MKKAKLTSDPINACFMDPSNARFVNVGSEEDDLAAAVAGSDWVIEVVQEDLERKQSLFAEIEKHRRPDTIVTSNTSTMPLSSLTEGRTEAFKENFAITHFFNPPHIMRLLEIVRGEATTDETANSLRDFCDEKLGKEVRFCNDTPAMMANRIGVYLLFRAVAEAYRLLSETENDVAVVAGDASPEAVHARIRGLLRDRFPETFPPAEG